MKLNVYAWYNKLGKYYLQPNADRTSKEALKTDAIRQMMTQPEKRQSMDQWEIHQIGVYDDKLGTFKNINHELIVDYAVIIHQLEESEKTKDETKSDLKA